MIQVYDVYDHNTYKIRVQICPKISEHLIEPLDHSNITQLNVLKIALFNIHSK